MLRLRSHSALCLPAILILLGICLEAQALQRVVKLRRGDAVTERWSSEIQGTESHQRSIFLVGYDIKDRKSLSSFLQTKGAAIVNSIADDHLLVASSSETIREIQEVFPSVTAGSVPAFAKLSVQDDELKQAVTSATSSCSNFSTILKEFPGLRTVKTEDGELQLLLFIEGAPLDPRDAQNGASAAAWASDVQSGLIAELQLRPQDSCVPRVVAKGQSGGVLQAKLCVKHASKALTWLSERGDIKWMSFAYSWLLDNIHASASIQSVDAGRVSAFAIAGDGALRNTFPFWTRGLTGNNEIVGVADSGIDLDSCYFWDQNFRAFDQNTQTINMGAQYRNFEAFINDNHRKVVAYFGFGNFVDNSDHGTHVASTIVGSPFGFDPVVDADRATGVAPGAKVAFFDVESEPAEGEEDFKLQLPNDMDEANGDDIVAMFTQIMDQDAHIISNSYGIPVFTYNSLVCKEVERFARDNDMLLIFAAGNNGLQQKPETGTVNLPALCKNVLAVGATENFFLLQEDSDESSANLLSSSGNQVDLNPNNQFGSAAVFYDLDNNGNVMGQIRAFLRYTIFDWPGHEGSLGRMENRRFEVVYIDNACESLQNQAGKVAAFVDNGDCSANEAAQNVIDAGAAAGLHFTSRRPSGGLSNSRFPLLYTTSGQLAGVVAERQIAMSPLDAPLDQHVAAFSSYGPPASSSSTSRENLGLRIKPDLVAPGIQLSADSDGTAFSGRMDQCAVTMKQGTSMAAPAVAGSAALARQYFREGFYPTGERTAGDEFIPSAPLLMAALIAGTTPLDGILVRDGLPVAAPPNRFQGYGRLNLTGSLPFKPDIDAGWRLQVEDRRELQEEGDAFRFAFESSGQYEITVTMAYFDAPAESNAESVLVNDLDLRIVGPMGAEWWGNARVGGDRYNAVEKVVIIGPAGQYFGEVRARSLPAGAQPFALVVLGGITAGGVNESSEPSPMANLSSDPSQPNVEQIAVDLSFEDGADLLVQKLAVSGSRQFERFRTGTTAALQRLLDVEGSVVRLDDIRPTVASSRRTLLQEVATATYFVILPQSFEADQAQEATQRLLDSIEGSSAVEVFGQEFTSEFRILSASARFYTPSTDNEERGNGAAPDRLSLLAAFSSTLWSALLLRFVS